MEPPPLAHPTLPPMQHYSYPVLAADRLSFVKARADPRCSNINNEMVMLWKDVVIEDDEKQLGPPGTEKSLEDTTLDEVMDGLFAVVQRHREDLERSRRDRGIQEDGDVFGTWLDSSEISRIDDVDNTLSEYPSGVQDSTYLAENKIDKYFNEHFGEDIDDHTYQNVDFIDVDDPFGLEYSEIDMLQAEIENLENSQNYESPIVTTSSNTQHDIYTTLNDNRSSRHDSGLNDSSGYFSSIDKSKSSVDSNNNQNTSFSYDDTAIDFIEDYSEVFEDGSAQDASGSEQHYNRPSSRPRSRSTSSHDLPAIDVRSVTITCQNLDCGKSASLEVARTSYRNCHNCHSAYCSRSCRKEDWSRHKSLCYASQVSSACKRVIRHCNKDPEVKDVLSRIARRGYLSRGRGCILLGFLDLSAVEEFLDYGFSSLELNPVYLTLKELKSSKMFGDIYDKLVDMCKIYKPDVKYVLNVGVGLRKNNLSNFHNHQHGILDSGHSNISRRDSERSRRSGSFGSDGGYCSLNCSISSNVNSPIYAGAIPSGGGAMSSHSRHKGPILQRCVRLRLSPAHLHAHGDHLTIEEICKQEISRYGPTLILKGIPGCQEDVDSKRKRELIFINIQRKLRDRGVVLRRQYPLVYADLIKFVKDGSHFPSQIIFPVDTKAKKLFTCFLMPEAEPDPEWTYSKHLLDDLDISRDCIWGSMSRSRSFPSSLQLSHTSAGHTVKQPKSPTCSCSHCCCHPCHHPYHHLAIPHRRPTSYARNSEMQRYKSAPNLTLNLTPPWESSSRAATFSLSPLHMDFHTCPPSAASSPKHPKLSHYGNFSHWCCHSHCCLARCCHCQAVTPYSKKQSWSTPDVSASPPAEKFHTCPTDDVISPLDRRRRHANCCHHRHLHQHLLHHQHMQQKCNSSRNPIYPCSACIASCGSCNHFHFFQNHIDGQSAEGLGGNHWSPGCRRKFNTNSIFFPSHPTFEKGRSQNKHETTENKDLSDDKGHPVTNQIPDNPEKTYLTHKTSSSYVTYPTDLQLSYTQPITPPWPPNKEYVHMLVHEWLASSPFHSPHMTSSSCNPSPSTSFPSNHIPNAHVMCGCVWSCKERCENCQTLSHQMNSFSCCFCCCCPCCICKSVSLTSSPALPMSDAGREKRKALPKIIVTSDW